MPAPSVRADYERAVERAWYRFVIGATRPFDEVYPRSVFEKRVARAGSLHAAGSGSSPSGTKAVARV